MKKIYTLIFAFTSAVAFGQQDPQFTQFFLNKLNYNPAFAGTEEKICGLLVYRTQWTGFGGTGNNQAGVPIGAAPVTFLGSINAPIGKRFGIGLNIYRDQQGFETLLNPTLSLSYIHTFQDQSKLSGGLGLGLMQKSMDGAQFRARQQNDDLVPTNTVTGNAFDLNGGIYYSRPTLWILDNFYGGLSFTHINRAEVQLTNAVVSTTALHTYIMTGASYALNSAIAIEPNILVKRDAAKWSTDINVMAMLNNKFRGGLTYRTEDAMSVLLGFRINDNMQIGYSYDLTLNNIIEYSSGSHEILFKYCFMPKVKVTDKPIVPRLTPRFL